MKRYFASSALAVLAFASTAQAQDARPLCTDRPGLGTSACTVGPGLVQVELGGADWTLDKDSAQRTDTIEAGDLLVRYGVAEHAEVQFGWTAFGTTRERDRISGATSRSSGTGDVLLALRRNLAHPDGSGFSAAVMPFATLPAGGSAIGAGDWSAGVLVPLSYEINDTFSIAASPEIDAEVDEDRRGRHLAYGSVIGLSAALSDAVTSIVEVQEIRHDDPAGHTDEALASVSLAWQPRGNLQLDVGAVAGLTHDSPDVQLHLGIARRF